MNRLRFRPHIRLIASVIVQLCFIIATAASKQPVLEVLALLSITCFTLIALLDLRRTFIPPAISVSRKAPVNLSMHLDYDCLLTITNNSRQSIVFDVQEHYPAEINITEFNRRVRLAPLEASVSKFRLIANRRGLMLLAGTEIRLDSPFRLWQCSWQFKNPHSMKVYPDFKLVRSTEPIDGVANTPVNGLKLYSRRGDGMEFHQLREYRRGDSLRQIDWKATSKRQKLISREYQEERNQQIIIMLDAGKRMNVRTETGSHFDTALGALLMLGHTVLHQGDWFSMQSFGESERWLPNVKGAQDISRVMNHFYDLYPDDCASDYLRAAQSLVEKKPKRALVLLVTTLGSEDYSDLMPAVALLQRHHLVAVVSFRNQAIAETLEQEVITDNDANTYCAAVELELEQNRNLLKLSKQGVICTQVSPGQLLPGALNVYLNVKQAGLL